MDTVTSVAGQLGVAAGFFLALILVLWWVGRYLDKRLEASKAEHAQSREDAKQERTQWQDKFEKMNENNTKQLEANGRFQESVSAAHELQRVAHQEMVTSLQEVTLTLKGMNGRMKVRA